MTTWLQLHVIRLIRVNNIENLCLIKFKFGKFFYLFIAQSVLEMTKEEDLLANIAHKLMHVITTNVKSDKLDLDIMIDITLLLWKKCKEVFQKYQTGSQDNYIWLSKLDNLSKVRNWGKCFLKKLLNHFNEFEI